ncbi:MAG: acyl carrier protein [Spirochaetales bacterium]|nr:acyl carrier protein [Spirochaetales bacterium]
MASDIAATTYSIIGEHCSVGKERDLKPESRLKDLGVNSINFIKVIVALEKEFGIDFDTDHIELANFETIRDIVTYVDERKRRIPDL